MEYLTVAARAVRPGDMIWNSHADRGHEWIEVTSVERREVNPGSDLSCTIVIHTKVYATWKHALEGVAVKRAAPTTWMP